MGGGCPDHRDTAGGAPFMTQTPYARPGESPGQSHKLHGLYRAETKHCPMIPYLSARESRGLSRLWRVPRRRCSRLVLRVVRTTWTLAGEGSRRRSRRCRSRSSGWLVSPGELSLWSGRMAVGRPCWRRTLEQCPGPLRRWRRGSVHGPIAPVDACSPCGSQSRTSPSGQRDRFAVRGTPNTGSGRPGPNLSRSDEVPCLPSTCAVHPGDRGISVRHRSSALVCQDPLPSCGAGVELPSFLLTKEPDHAR